MKFQAQCKYGSCARCVPLGAIVNRILDRPIKTAAPLAANWSDHGEEEQMETTETCPVHQDEHVSTENPASTRSYHTNPLKPER